MIGLVRDVSLVMRFGIAFVFMSAAFAPIRLFP